MTKLHVPPGDTMVSKCSGGERRRVALCKVLLEHPDVLLLDEPTNHLDVESVSWLETTLAEYKGTVVVITHDRFFLDRVVSWMLEIFHGRCDPVQGQLLGVPRAARQADGAAGEPRSARGRSSSSASSTGSA